MPNRKWKSKDVITAGVDVGSVGSKAAIMVDGKLQLGHHSHRLQQPRKRQKSPRLWHWKDTGLKASDLKYIVGTGYGRVNVPMANKAITEIACHAKGANYIWGPSVSNRP